MFFYTFYFALFSICNFWYMYSKTTLKLNKNKIVPFKKNAPNTQFIYSIYQNIGIC